MTNKLRELADTVINNILKEADELTDFVSVAQTNNSFDTSKINANVYSDDDTVSEDKKEEKTKLTTQAIEKIKQNLKVSDELQSILNKIKKLNDEMDINEWKVNEEDNTAILKNKNAYIFKQNDNLCLSHNGKIEIFKSVAELHEWLKANNYPLPHNIKLHESVITEAPELSGDYKLFDTSDIIPSHPKDDVAFRMKMYYGDSPWASILSDRWDSIGTQKGKVLGYNFDDLNAELVSDYNNYEKDEFGAPIKPEEAYIKVMNTDQGPMYYDVREYKKDKNLALYADKDFKANKQTPSAYFHPEDNTITTLNTYGAPETADEFDARNQKTRKDIYKMGKDATKAAMNTADFHQVGSQTRAVRDTNLGAFNNPAYAKIVDKVGIDRAQKYIGDVSGEYCIDINGKKIGTVRDKKVYDIKEPDIRIGKVGFDGHCFKESDLEEDQIENLWYLKYQNSGVDQNYLNANWRNSDLLTQNLEDAAKFIDRNDAINELQNLYVNKLTQFPFKPVNVDEMEECGAACATTTASLGSAVQYVGNPKKKEENADEDLDEASKYDLSRQYGRNKRQEYLKNAPVVDKNGNVIGYTSTDITNTANDLFDDNNTQAVADNEGNIIATSHENLYLAFDMNDRRVFGYIDEVNNPGLVFGADDMLVGYYRPGNTKVYSDDKYQNRIGALLNTEDNEKAPILVDNEDIAIGYINDEGIGIDFNGKKLGNVVDTARQEQINKYDNKRLVYSSRDNQTEDNLIGYAYPNGTDVYSLGGKQIGTVDIATKAIELGDSAENIQSEMSEKEKKTITDKFGYNFFGKTDTAGKPLYMNPYDSKGNPKGKYANVNKSDLDYFSNLFKDTWDSTTKALIMSPEEFKKKVEELNKRGYAFDPESQDWPHHTNKFAFPKDSQNQKEYKKMQQDWTDTVYKPSMSQKGLRGITKDAIDQRFVGPKMNKDESFSGQLLQSLKEDDPTPADFADGGAQDTSLADVTASETNTSTNNTVSDGLDDYGPEEPTNNAPAQFGDVNINAGSGNNDEEPAPVPESNEKIIDVLVNEKDPTQIKLKVKNLDTGEITVKDLNEIDV